MFLSFEIEKELLIVIPIPALRITVKPALATTHLLKVVGSLKTGCRSMKDRLLGQVLLSL